MPGREWRLPRLRRQQDWQGECDPARALCRVWDLPGQKPGKPQDTHSALIDYCLMQYGGGLDSHQYLERGLIQQETCPVTRQHWPNAARLAECSPRGARKATRVGGRSHLGARNPEQLARAGGKINRRAPGTTSGDATAPGKPVSKRPGWGTPRRAWISWEAEDIRIIQPRPHQVRV